MDQGIFFKFSQLNGYTIQYNPNERIKADETMPVISKDKIDGFSD